jgi:four helix bundle protein
MPNGAIQEKSFEFAVRIVKLCKHLRAKKKEYVVCRQVLRSGTSIGALVREAQHAESKADFVHKMAIALKEANEKEYWLTLLQRTEYLDGAQFKSIHRDVDELIRLPVAILKSAKRNKRMES